MTTSKVAFEQNGGDEFVRAARLFRSNNYGEALALLERVIAAHPTSVDGLLSYGNTLFELNRNDEAIACYDKVIAIEPDHPDAHFGKAFPVLANGDYALGWKLYEWRWKTKPFHPLIRKYDQPQWSGDADLGGKTILIYGEQGFGDSIQFSRYLKLFNNCRVIFEVRKPLAPLFRDYEIAAQGEPLPSFDYHCPLMSLPLAFQTTIETIPTALPIRADAAKIDKWRKLLGKKTKPRVGLTWAGHPHSHNDSRRSIPLETLLPIMTDNVEWFSLQSEVRDSDRKALGRAPLRDYTRRLHDFAETAALISHMDVVISVDTSIAHLAGALGKPLWLLLAFHPDFRWLRDRTDSPWYPTARLFRQSSDGAWPDVLQRVGTEIARSGQR
jgi:hypothetical protein